MTLEDHFRRWHSPTIFTLVALCFLLPFGTVTFLSSCESGRVPYGHTSFTGIQLVARTVPPGAGVGQHAKGLAHTHWRELSNELARETESTGATGAEIALAAALVGLVLGIFGFARGPGWCAGVGLGALLYVPLAFKFSPDLGWDAHAGWWLAALLFAWAAGIHARRAWERKPRTPAPPLSTPDDS